MNVSFTSLNFTIFSDSLKQPRYMSESTWTLLGNYFKQLTYPRAFFIQIVRILGNFGELVAKI